MILAIISGIIKDNLNDFVGLLNMPLKLSKELEISVTLIMEWIEWQINEKGAQLCENLCEKNFPKSAKIGKNWKKPGKSYLTNSVTYNKLRRLGNPEAVTENPRVGSSILSLGTSKINSLQSFSVSYWCFWSTLGQRIVEKISAFILS